jgi:DNA polymerase-3 subunit delta
MAEPAVENPSFRVVWGDDDFAVKRQARRLFDEWSKANPGADEEIIDASAGNSDEALKALARLRESLQTLPFFGGTKSIWFRDCNFLGDERAAMAEAVVSNLADLLKELAAFRWSGVRLLLSAGSMDRRRTFYKTLGKLAVMEHFPGLSAEDKDWREKGENLAAAEFRSAGKSIAAEALSSFVEQVGANARALSAEAQKLVAYVGDRPAIVLEDVDAIVTRGRHARAFALADAFGERNLARTLKHLDEELWSMQSDRQKSEIGLLYGLISKVRALLMTKEMLAEGWIRPTTDYRGFQGQLAALKEREAGRLPVDRRCNPLEINSYVLFRAAQQSKNFSRDELVRAMEELLKCNRLLVGSGLEGGLVLQLAVSRLLTRPPAREGGGRGRPPLEARPRRS